MLSVNYDYMGYELVLVFGMAFCLVWFWCLEF